MESAWLNQIMNLSLYGCPDETLWELEDLKTKVLIACQELIGDYQFPFLPILPKPYLKLCKKFFRAKHGVRLWAEDNQYCDGDIYTKPYYLIGTKILTTAEIKKTGECDANFSEIISLSLFSGLSGAFYAQSGYYIIESAKPEHPDEKSLDNKDQEKKLGIWLNTKNGATGPFLKDQNRYPIIRSAGRILLN